jgi:hypothetical protein
MSFVCSLHLMGKKMMSIDARSMSQMTETVLYSSYIEAVVKLSSYVGSDGLIEDSLWNQVKLHQKMARKNHIDLPSVELIQSTQEDWS